MKLTRQTARLRDSDAQQHPLSVEHGASATAYQSVATRCAMGSIARSNYSVRDVKLRFYHWCLSVYRVDLSYGVICTLGVCLLNWS